jgi:hypothetical protein
VDAGSGEDFPNLPSAPPLIFGLVVPTSGGGTTCIPIFTDGGGRLHGATVDAALNQLDSTRPDALHNKERGRRRVVGLCRPPFGKDVTPWKSSRSTISWPHPRKGRTPVQASKFVHMEVTAGQHTDPLTLEDTWRFADTTRSEAQPNRHFRLVWTCTSCTESVVQQPELQLCCKCDLPAAAAAISANGAAANAGGKCLCLTSWVCEIGYAGRRTDSSSKYANTQHITCKRLFGVALAVSPALFFLFHVCYSVPAALAFT